MQERRNQKVRVIIKTEETLTQTDQKIREVIKTEEQTLTQADEKTLFKE